MPTSATRRTDVKTVQLNNGTCLSFEDRGAGDPLFLLHAFTGTGRDWQLVFDFEALASRYRIIIPDARGHGLSTDPGERFTFQRCALDVLELADRLGIAAFQAAGMSLGAKTLLHVATAAPERVRKLVLVSGTPRFPEPTRDLLRRIAASPHSDEEWAQMRNKHPQGDACIERLWSLPARFAEDERDLCFSPQQLHTIRASTLIVSGDRDPLYPVELAVELYRGIPNSYLYVVPNAGHNPVFGPDRERFVDRALTFLAES